MSDSDINKPDEYSRDTDESSNSEEESSSSNIEDITSVVKEIHEAIKELEDDDEKEEEDMEIEKDVDSEGEKSDIHNEKKEKEENKDIKQSKSDKKKEGTKQPTRISYSGKSTKNLKRYRKQSGRKRYGYGTIRKILYKAGVTRVSRSAIEFLMDLLGDKLKSITKIAIIFAEHSRKKTITKKELLLALSRANLKIYA